MPNVWDSEPDAVDFDFRGLPCRILRVHHLKTLNGYVGLPAGHPDHGKPYDEIDVETHGGLTYAAPSLPNATEDGRWWIGFDCAHAGDFVPSYPAMMMCDGVYRDIGYVKDELMSLAEQMLARA